MYVMAIDGLWQDQGFMPVSDLHYEDSSVRRTTFESYAARVDWPDVAHVERSLRVFESHPCWLARHALVVDDQLRSLFAYLRTTVVPTSLFAAPEDWSDPALAKRIDRAALDLLLLMESGFAQQVRDESWHSYQHEFGSAGGTELTIDLDSELMRLATGGPPPERGIPGTSAIL
jgi:hypothetical protein